MKRKDIAILSIVVVSFVLNVLLAAGWYHAKTQQKVKAAEAAATLIEGQKGEWEFILHEVRSHDPERLARLEQWLERGMKNIAIVHDAVQTAAKSEE